MVFRLGLLLPSSNTTMEPELYRMTPSNVTIHTARMLLEEVTTRGLERMAKDAPRAAGMLKTANMDVLLYGCTSGSLIKGKDWEYKLVNDLWRTTAIPTISTGGAIVKAIRTLGINHIGVVTPYIDEINRLERNFLEDIGIKVTSIKGLGITENPKISEISPNCIKALVKEVSQGSDGVFISCTNLPIVDHIEELENDLNLPIVTSNQASLWAVLKSLETSMKKGFGKLSSV